MANQEDLPSLCVMRVCRFLSFESFASAGFATMLTRAMPSRPIIFSKSTNPCSFLLTFSRAIPKYVPFELDLRRLPQYGAGGSDIVI